MKCQVTFEHCEDHEGIRKVFRMQVARLEKRVKGLPKDSVFLHGAIERYETKSRYRACLVLNVPGRTLVAKEQGINGEAVVREAFLELERQVKKYKEFMRAEPIWKRKGRREAIRTQLKAAIGYLREEEKPLVWDTVLSNLDALYNFIRREIAHYWAAGEIKHRGEVQVKDLLDKIIVRIVREFPYHPPRLRPKVWLFKIALEEIEGAVERLRRERQLFVRHIEEDVPEVPTDEELKTLGDWIYEFYQPDEDLRVEDVIADPKAVSPEEIVESRDVQRLVTQTLAKMPKAWRDAFVLYYVEDLTIPEVAHLTGQSESEAGNSIEHAREFLRRHFEKALVE